MQEKTISNGADTARYDPTLLLLGDKQKCPDAADRRD
jgi:hypothetical protein